MMNARNRGISDTELASVFGGMRWEDFRQSDNVEDRRGDTSQYTPTEDGRIVGPNGEWDWDRSANQNQPPVHNTPTEDGYIYGSDGTLREDDSINATFNAEQTERDLRANPEYQDTANYVSDALNGPMTPTEDGMVVGQSGRAYEDPSINANQVEQRTPEAGEYVGGGEPYPEEAPAEEPGGGSYDGGYEGGQETGGSYEE